MRIRILQTPILWLAMGGAAAWAQTYTYDDAGRLIRVANANGTGVSYTYDDSDNLLSATGLSLPVAPTDLDVTRTSSTTARLTWRAGAGSTGGFVVLRRSASGGDWAEIATVAAGTTTFIDTTLSPSQEYVYRVAAQGSGGRSASSREVRPASTSAVNLAIAGKGARSLSTVGTSAVTRGGYATVEVESGSTPYGVAVFKVVTNGVVISEAAVPASPPTRRGRIFIEQRNSVTSAGNQFLGAVNILTGFGISNPGSRDANIVFTLRDASGGLLTRGTASLAAGAHTAKLLHELISIAPAFALPADFATRIGFGSLDLESDRPISIMALRATINQRGELLLTSTPVADLETDLSQDPVYFPHFADGGGFATAVILLNPTSAVMRGTLEIFGDGGGPLAVANASGAQGASFEYLIPPDGVYVFESTGGQSVVRGGWVRVTPSLLGTAPYGAGVFRVASGGVVISESGIPSAALTTRALIYIDKSSGYDTGIAIAYPGATALSVTASGFETDGSTPAGAGSSFAVPGRGHRADLAGQFISGLPAGFRGILELTAPFPFAALTLRALINSRGDLLLTTFPIADQTRPAPEPVIFPHLADGGGFQTELILLGPVSPAQTRVQLLDDSGAPLDALTVP